MHQGNKAKREILVLRVNREILVLKEKRESLVLRVNKVILVLKANKEFREILVLQGRKAPKDKKV